MRSDAPLIDLLVGGFPCQDVSVAGRRAGLAGERTSLFFDAMRVVEALRPEWVLLENVPGLLSSNGGRDFGVVLGTLADLGYGVAWRTLDSRFFGVPQRRRRVFILGALADGDPRAAAERAGQVLAVGEGCGRHLEKGDEARPDVASTLGASAGKGRGHDGNPFDRGGHSSLSGLGNGGPDDNDAQAGRLVVSDTVRSHPRPGSNSNGLMVFASKGGGGGAFNDDGIAPTLNAHGSDEGGQPPAITFTSRGREDGVQTEAQTDGVHPALRSGRGGGRRDSGIAGPEIGVRRLTPTECERLQSLPDGWTLIDGASDSKRYAALGDAVTANVAEWIGARLPA